MNVMEMQRSLRQLRLGGMAETLEPRILEAQSEKLPPIDFLKASCGRRASASTASVGCGCTLQRSKRFRLSAPRRTELGRLGAVLDFQIGNASGGPDFSVSPDSLQIMFARDN